ncbi:MAG: DUF1566 domain-containing protein [Bacteroidota bacterium]
MRLILWLILPLLMLLPIAVSSQVSINQDNSDPDAAAMLDIKSINKGILIPRMTSTQRVAIQGGTPATGLLVFDITTNSFWFYSGASWEDLSANEYQTLSLSEDTIKLSNGGYVKLPADEVPDPMIPIPIRYQGEEVYVHPTDNASGVDWSTAQSTCANLTAYGHSDWYLPTRLELDAMYKQSYLISGLSQIAIAKYWSDTEYDASNAYTQRLDYGGPDPDPKSDSAGHNCRCVRKN